MIPRGPLQPLQFCDYVKMRLQYVLQIWQLCFVFMCLESTYEMDLCQHNK